MFGLIPERRVNNGQPSLHATLIAAAAPSDGERVVHVGAGVGYYSAIMAYLVGATGRVTAIEIDPGLARCARANVVDWPQVTVVHGDGTSMTYSPANVIYVNAGVTHPANIWLDALADGGRLILPLTTIDGFIPPKLMDPRPHGGVFLITRRGTGFQARMLAPLSIIPCEGLRTSSMRLLMLSRVADGIGSHVCTGIMTCRRRNAGCVVGIGLWRMSDGGRVIPVNP